MEIQINNLDQDRKTATIRQVEKLISKTGLLEILRTGKAKEFSDEDGFIRISRFEGNSFCVCRIIEDQLNIIMIKKEEIL